MAIRERGIEVRRGRRRDAFAWREVESGWEKPRRRVLPLSDAWVQPLAYEVARTEERRLVLSARLEPAVVLLRFLAAEVAARAADAWSYTFLGQVAGVEDLGPLAGDAARHKVRIRFDQIR